MPELITGQGKVSQDTFRSEGEGVSAPLKINKRGEVCVIDFYTQMMLEGRGYTIKAGEISSPVTAAVDITTLKAEMCVDATSGSTIIPVWCNLSIQILAGATVCEWGLKSVGANSSAGTAFTPLPLLMGGNACRATARVQPAKNVTIAQDAATTTRVHWFGANPLDGVAGHDFTTYHWTPVLPPVDAGPACCYFVAGSTGAGFTYFASLDFLELPTANIS